MRRSILINDSLVMLFLALATALCTGVVHAQSLHTMTKADVERLHSELSNWGRWGDDDQLGALNLITPEKRKQAAGLVREGVSVSLARNAEEVEAADNPDPFSQVMLKTGNEPGNQWAVDTYSVLYHGFAHTHMDSLCHLLYQGKMYNGYSQTEITDQGTAKLSIHNAKSGIFTRGVLIDIPALRGVEYLEPGTPIYPEELTAWENRAGLKVGSGDVVFFRTGRWARRAAKGPWSVEELGAAGLHASCAKWIRERDVAMVGSDAAMDVMPSGIPGMTHPIHLLTLNAMGVHIFDNCDLEAVSKTCGQLKRWDFLITAAPIPVEGGTGSPLNPIASF
ncbi:MAG: cyclase family protein [Planctomycetota bacterium]|nr:cyclase family protein [Planctomycetota bacterium]